MSYQAVLAELTRPGFPALAGLNPNRSWRMLRAYLDEMACVKR
jgi:hypothetical protein